MATSPVTIGTGTPAMESTVYAARGCLIAIGLVVNVVVLAASVGPQGRRALDLDRGLAALGRLAPQVTALPDQQDPLVEVLEVPDPRGRHRR